MTVIAMTRHTFKKIRQPHALQAILAAVGVGVVGISLLFISFAATSTVKLYLAPASKSVNVGDSFTVKVKLQSDQQLRYVKAYVNFPASKLQVTSISSANSDFPTKSEEAFDNTAGHVKFTRSSSNNRTGTLEVASITFKAKQSGTAPVSFDSSSAAASNQYYPYPNLLTATAGGTYTITTPAPPPPPPPGGNTGGTGGTGGSSGSGSSSGTGASTPNTSTPKAQSPAASNSTTPTADTTTPSETSLEASSDPNFSEGPGASQYSPDGSETAGTATTHHRKPLTAIVTGIGVLVGLGAIGGAIVLNKRRPKVSLPEQENLTPEQVEAEMSSSLLSRDDANQLPAEVEEQLPPQDDDVPAPPYQHIAEQLPPEAIQKEAIPTTSEPLPPVPTPQPTSNPIENPDEPKDMFDTAEEQFHYNEKFKTKPKPKSKSK